MLISFSVSNFRSIGSEQTLNLVASNKISDHPNHTVPIDATQKSVVRTAVIYGANAAGKSNLVRAMATAQGMVNASERHVPVIEPFRFSTELAAKPTSFEFRFLLDDRVFIYGFDVKGRIIHTEWLSVLQGSEERLVFERNQEGQTHPAPDVASIFPKDDAIANLLKLLASLPLTQHQLFLNRANTIPLQAQSDTLRAVLRWLARDLLVLLPDHRSSDILDRISEDDEFRRLAESFLNSVGTGVGSLELTTEEIDAESINRFSIRGRLPSTIRRRGALDDVRPKPDDPTRFISRKLFATHSIGAVLASLPFSEESDGTQQLLHLMPVLAAVKRGAKVVVIDELDRSLHPLICWEFIRLFSETAPGAHKQLIVTTHEAHLLSQELLRRDEYWFVEKDGNQQTQLVSLSDFKIRNDLKIEKGYLHGRFGGIPIIGPMTELEKLLGRGRS
jgi:AAA15 family ATPase/GTPase